MFGRARFFREGHLSGHVNLLLDTAEREVTDLLFILSKEASVLLAAPHCKAVELSKPVFPAGQAHGNFQNPAQSLDNPL